MAKKKPDEDTLQQMYNVVKRFHLRGDERMVRKAHNSIFNSAEFDVDDKPGHLAKLKALIDAHEVVAKVERAKPKKDQDYDKIRRFLTAAEITDLSKK